MAAKRRSDYQEGSKLVAILPLYMPHELKDLLAEEADKDDLAMSEVVVRVLAERYGRPDLAIVPRKRPGRPRKEVPA